MQGMSIYGLVLSLASLAECGVSRVYGVDSLTDSFFPSVDLKALKKNKTLIISEPVPLNEPDITNLLNFQTNIPYYKDKIGNFWKDKLTKYSKTDDKDFLIKKLNKTHYSLFNFEAKESKLQDRMKELFAQESKSRVKRQSEPLIRKIVTMEQVVRGADDKENDQCLRHEVEVDFECHEVLTQGPCEDNEFVLIDEESRKGFCAPRLCSPDRVFVFEDQKCHDPFENDICSPGRQLSTSSFGTPVCTCPDGTYEEEEDPDEDVCVPILSKLESCNRGQVFWFTDFRSEPRCIPDPCSGINAQKGENEMPYIPSKYDGKCYQVGKEIPLCSSDQFYTISFEGLYGICASLEDAGYLVADEDVLMAFKSRYGDPLKKTSGSLSFVTPSESSRDQAFSSKKSGDNPSLLRRSRDELSQSRRFDDERSPSDRNRDEPSEHQDDITEDLERNRKVKELRDLLTRSQRTKSLSDGLLDLLLRAARRRANSSLNRKNARRVNTRRRKSFVEEEDEENEEQELQDEEEEERHSRRKRDSLSYASPANVFEPALAPCKAGARRGINNRCRTSILPSRRPLSRPRRSTPPTRPIPSCAKGYFYKLGYKCVNNSGQRQGSILSLGLG